MPATRGTKALRRIQWAKEVTPGTKAAATAIWRGTGGDIQDGRTLEQIDELVGIIGGTDRTILTALAGSLSLAESPLTFEQGPYLNAMQFGGPTVGVADGAGTGKVYLTNIPTTAGVTPVPYSIEAGDDHEAEYMTYCLVTKQSFKGEMKKAVTVSADIMGRSVDPMPGGNFTALSTLQAIEDIVTNKGKVYLDPVSGAYGTTQVSDTILGFNVDIETFWIPKPTMDGNLFYSFATYAGHKITGSIEFEHNASADGIAGEKLNWRNNTPRLLDLTFLGSALATPGTYTNKTFRLRFPIRWLTFDSLGDRDGNSTVTGNFASRYNSTVGNAGSITYVNNVTTLA